MKDQKLSFIKIFPFIFITALIIISIAVITKYGSSHNAININRLPLQNSRLASISLGYTDKKMDTNYLTKSYEAYQELFTIEDLLARREFLMDYFSLSRDTLQKPVIGDPIVAKRFEILLLDTAINGLYPGETFTSRLASAAGLTPYEVASILQVSQKIGSPDTFLKHYPNLASPEWEIFIQSQELNQLLQDFPD